MGRSGGRGAQWESSYCHTGAGSAGVHCMTVITGRAPLLCICKDRRKDFEYLHWKEVTEDA